MEIPQIPDEESESSSCILDWDTEEKERIIRSRKLISLTENKKLFKQILRMGISTLHRPEAYLTLSGIKTLADELRDFWPDTVKVRSEPKYQNIISIFGYPNYDLFIPKAFLQDFLTIVKNQNKEIQFSPMIPSVASILLLYLEPDLAYLALQSMINNTDKYFVKNKENFVSMLSTINKLIQLNNKKLYDHSKSIKLDLSVVALILMPILFSKKLNRHIVLTIFDSFMNEGRTVLMRYIIALVLKLESDLIQTKSPCEFVQTIFDYIISLHNPNDIRELTRLAFGLTFIKRNRIFPLEQNERLNDHFLNGAIKNRLPHIEEFYNFYSHSNNTYDGRKTSHITINQMLYSKINGGQLITSTQFWNLKKKLHYSFLHYNAFPIFRLSEDGSSLNTFYKKAKSISPSMLIIKAETKTIGAILVNPIDLKYKKRFYGSPLTTVFELENLNTYRYSRKNEYFVSAAIDSVTIGNGTTGSAIYFEEGFQNVVSDYCETFNSPPLLNSQREEIIDVELYKLSP